ncbi:MAG: hydrogenase maturation protease [Candidatus Heimdallarchaeota archaeon]|nr:hydrogenase maturation protease [Candidatus Heimdallarchaeota archaeon]
MSEKKSELTYKNQEAINDCSIDPPTENSLEKKVHIIGIGNLTRLDDGVAIRIIQELKKESLPKTVKITDLGTGGIDIPLALSGWNIGIIIDAINMDNLEPGEIINFEIKDDYLPEISGLSSSHGFDALIALKLAYTLNDFSLPEKIVIIGIQIKKIEGFGLELSSEVEQAIPKVLKKIKVMIAQYT